MSDLKKPTMIVCVCAVLAACGQTGKLYLPSESGEVTTRSTQTPPESGTSNSPPAPGNESDEDDKSKKTPPPEPPKN